jgi:hypothetical protein
MQRSHLPRLFLVGMTAIATVVLSSAPAMADASNWKVGYYTPSGQTLSFAESGNAGLASLNFTDQANTALLVTTHGAAKGSTLGDLTGKPITATFEITGAATPFIFFGEPFCGTTSAVRLFFQTSNAGGFDETHYWWSNPVSFVLANTSGPAILTASLSDPGAWSDFFGHFGNDPTYSAGFAAAVSNVTTIGLSFGGGCFFENGVGTTDGSGTFTLDTFTVG